MEKTSNKIRIHHARIISMQGKASHEAAALPVINGEIHICNDKITYVGASQSAPSAHWDREIDADGNIIMPGFKNAHTHSGMTFLRSYADDLPLHNWLYDKVFPLEALLTPEDIYWCSRLAIMEYLTSGITANFDMYQKTDAIVRASVDSGYRTVLCGSVNNFVSSVEELEQHYLRYNDHHPLITSQLGFHAEYTTSEEILRGSQN